MLYKTSCRRGCTLRIVISEEADAMKVFLVTLTFTLTLFFSVSSEAAVFSGGLRQGLLESPDVEAFYAVDSTHTFVKGALPLLGQGEVFTVVERYYGGPGHSHPAVMVEHGVEPMMAKGSASEALRGLAPLKRGKVLLSSDGGGFTAIDVFEAATLTCQRRGGYALYLVPRKYSGFKRLTEVGALEAFTYIISKGSAGLWFAACEGAPEVRFQVLKNYDFINDGQEMAEFREGLAFDDVNYVKNEGAEAARLAALESSWPRTHVSLEATARKIAAVKMGFVRKFDGKRNYGSYKGSMDKGRCASVSIKSVSDAGEVRVSEAHEYKVCSGKVYALGVTEREERIAGGAGMYVREKGFKVAKAP